MIDSLMKNDERRRQRAIEEGAGCDNCDGTAYVAERREGITYPVACPECASNLRDGAYHYGVEEYHIYHTE